MEKKIIATQNAPGAIGPYSQGIDTGSLVFTSGQIPIDPKNGQLVSGDVRLAAKQSLENVKAILEAAGSSMDRVVKTTVLLRDLDDFAAVNEVYGEYFRENQPARACFQAAKLPMDALVEIEAVAYK